MAGALADVVDRLTAAGCVAADEEAEELVAAAPDAGTLEAWIRRRERGEPLAWITGSLRFCDRTVRVDPGVYVPRVQTEDLARRAGALLAATVAAAFAGTGVDAGGSTPGAAGPGGARGVGGAGPRRVRGADLCAGSGAVAAHLRAAAPGAAVVAVDRDPRAVACARRNGVPAVLGDLDRPLRPRVFDLVTAVAPYVPTGHLPLLPADVRRYEPRLALDGGDDGLAVVRRVVAAAARLLRPGGWLLTELGGDQDRALGPALAAAGFDAAEPWGDEDGDLRGLAARRAG